MTGYAVAKAMRAEDLGHKVHNRLGAGRRREALERREGAEPTTVRLTGPKRDTLSWASRGYAALGATLGAMPNLAFQPPHKVKTHEGSAGIEAASLRYLYPPSRCLQGGWRGASP